MARGRGRGVGRAVPGASNARRAPSARPPDCWLHVRLFYGSELVREATSRTADGCRLSPEAVNAAERLLGPPPRVAQVGFPEPPPGARVLQRLLRHLERGVLLWVAPEGVFAKRLCRGRVYWRGPLAPHRAQPNKLERERTCQLLDTRRFLEGKSATVGPRAAWDRVAGQKGRGQRRVGTQDVSAGEWDSGLGMGMETRDVTHKHWEWERIIGGVGGDLGTDVDIGLWGM